MKKVILVLLFIAVLLVAGCLDTPKTNTIGTENDPGTELTNDDDLGTVDNPVEKSLSEEFLDSVSDLGSNYIIKYKLIDNDGALATMDIYVKGDRIRADYIPEDKSKIVRYTSKYSLPEGVYGCNETFTGFECTELFGENERLYDADPASIFGIRDEDMRLNPEKYSFTDMGTRVVIGETAKCYGIEYASDFFDGNTKVVFCLAKGTIFSGDFVDGDFTETILVTEYSTIVPDSYFELPAEPEDSF